MKKVVIVLGTIIVILCILLGCVLMQMKRNTQENNKAQNIPFSENQLYAVAYLGFDEMENLSYYVQKYLTTENIPIHYVSKGDYYLIIPRYSDMQLTLYKNDIQDENKELIFEEKDCRPFIIQCNISDIFSDVTMTFQYQNETAEYTPFISLENGEVMVGERGLNITK